MSNHFFFPFTYTATTEIYTLSLHDALPIYEVNVAADVRRQAQGIARGLPDPLRERIGYACLIGRAYAVLCEVARGRKPQSPVGCRTGEEKRQRRIKDPIPTTEYGLGRCPPGKTNAWLKLGLLRVTLVLLVAACSGVKKAAPDPVTQGRIRNFVGQRILHRSVKTYGYSVVTLPQISLVFVAQPGVERKVGSQAEVVVDVSRIVTGEKPKRGGRQNAAAVRVAEKQACDAVSRRDGVQSGRVALGKGLREREESAAVVAVGEIDSDHTIGSAAFNAVTTDRLGIVGEEGV